jgi:hypothetical protein
MKTKYLMAPLGISGAFHLAVQAQFKKHGINLLQLTSSGIEAKITELVPASFSIYTAPRVVPTRQVYRGYVGKRRNR